VKRSDLFFILTVLASLTGSGTLILFGQYVDVLAPGWGVKTIALLSIVSLAAGMIVRQQAVKAGAPATAIVQNPSIVPDGTAVVKDSTTILPIENTTQQKGP
jgi:hypothetical protein